MTTEVSYTSTQTSTFIDRYALRDKNGQLIENSPSQMWKRVAAYVARAEEPDMGWEERFYELLEDFKYVPGGRILASMGSDSDVTPYNCFVIPSPEDSREGILKSLGEWVEIQSRGGGVGINVSTLRPRGAPVKGVNGTSSGPIPWAHIFTVATRDVIQQGGSRRGAAMVMLNDNHPDLHEFITTKRVPGLLEGANVSVCLSDAFMEAVEKDDWWYPDRQYGYFNKVVDRRGNSFDVTIEKVERWKAKDIFDLIISSAWASGEPGIYFMERANKMSNSWYFEKFEATNPCAEQPLGPYSVCLLGSMNIAAYVHDWGISWTDFKTDVRAAVRFNDNIIDLAYYPLQQTKDTQQNIRRMGIGLMGLADAHIKMGIKYGSPESFGFVEEAYRHLRDGAYEGSVELAKERGAFPNFIAKMYLQGEFVKQLPDSLKADIKAYGIRNCFLLTQAPTGTTSQLAGVMGGIEPLFDRKFLRTDRIGEYEVTNSLWDSPFAVTSNELTPEQHVEIQSIAQKYNDSSISKTVNAPADATVEECGEAYRLAYKKGLKSIAYYRDQSRQEQVMHHIEETESIKEVIARSTRIPLPDERHAVNHKFMVGGQKGYATVGMYEDGTAGELFLKIAKEGSTIAGFADALAVTVSIALQYGVPLEAITEKLRLTHFEPSGLTGNALIPTATSMVDYLGHWLEHKFLGQEMQVQVNGRRNGNGHGVVCSECGHPMMFVEGCWKCSCGWSKC